MTNKSKLGLSAGLAGALVYLLGGFNVTVLILLIIAVAVWEDNEFVKVSTGRAAFIYVAYHLVEKIFSVLHNLLFELPFISKTVVGYYLSNFHNVVWDILSYAYNIVFILLAILAICNPVVKKNVIDKLIDTFSNLSVRKPAQQPVNAQPVQQPVQPVQQSAQQPAATKTCPECGKEVSESAAFCTSCGHKF